MGTLSLLRRHDREREERLDRCWAQLAMGVALLCGRLVVVECHVSAGGFSERGADFRWRIFSSRLEWGWCRVEWDHDVGRPAVLVLEPECCEIEGWDSYEPDLVVGVAELRICLCAVDCSGGRDD